MKSICLKCNGVYASPQSLWNHRQRCKADNKRIREDAASYPSYEEEIREKKSKNYRDVTNDDVSSVDDQEERIDRSEVLAGEIDDLIDKFIDESFPGSKNMLQEQIDHSNDEIWHLICEHREFEEKEGGLINYAKASLNPRKRLGIWTNENESDKQNMEEQCYIKMYQVILRCIKLN